MSHANTRPADSGRLKSLDVLRGFDMFWIIGGGTLITTLASSKYLGGLAPLAEQFSHVEWAGFRFYDLIFPLFMFISGVAIPIAIDRRREKGIQSSAILKGIWRRGILLVLLGIFYNGALRNGFDNARYASVLGQIGLAYALAATIVLYVKNVRHQSIFLLAILALISMLQLVVPVPGMGTGILQHGVGINAWLDQTLLPGRLNDTTFDPEGVLCIVSATSVTLLGAISGFLLRLPLLSGSRKTIWLLAIGVALVLSALLLSPIYPIIKKIWTVPFNMLTGGISMILLSIFYYSIDVRSLFNGVGKYLVLFFSVIGFNSITIYLGSRIIPFRQISEFFTGWLSAPLGPWIVVLGVIVIEWMLLYYLYQKKIFLRV